MSDTEKKKVGNTHFGKLMAMSNKDNKKVAVSSYLTKFGIPVNINTPLGHFQQVKTDFIFNMFNMLVKLTIKNKEQSVIFEQSLDSIRFLSYNLETYLKNVLQQLIMYNRRRVYSYDIPFKPMHQKISLQTYNFKKEILPKEESKIIYSPYKNLNVFFSGNVDNKIKLLNRYKKVKLKKKDEEIKEKSPIKDNDNKINNNNDSDDSIEEKTQYDINIFKSGDVTRNCKVQIEEKSKKKIELQDLISFLENNDKTPLQRLILQKAYIKMTSPFIKNNVNK